MAAPGRRPLAAHTFRIEVELVTADDIGADSLVSTLTQLATAGLHGMVVKIVNVVLDGTYHQAEMRMVDPAVVKLVFPPVDPRVTTTLLQVETLISNLRNLLGSSPPLNTHPPPLASGIPNHPMATAG